MDQDSNRVPVNPVAPQPVRANDPGLVLESPQISLAFRLLTCGFLAIATLAIFWPVLHSGFINLDDGEYVLDNPHVATGFTIGNAAWSFTTGHASNWHPLTWLSHMLDVQWFGLNPAAHHAVSLLLHIVNAVALLLLLVRLTGAPWQSFAVAALFAMHPLHVESVAWIAERKDVLSTLFFLLTIWFYSKYVAAQNAGSAAVDSPANSSIAESSPSLRRNHLARRFSQIALLLFALGLMSKPMLVTLPFILLLLDFWPLGRFGQPGAELQSRTLLPLLKEKIPFLALAAVSSVITLIVQAQGHAVQAFLPLHLRIQNAVVSYVAYLWKTIWPAGLSAFYPHPNTRYLLQQKDPLHPASEQWPWWGIVLGAAMLVAVSCGVLRWRRRAPWLLTGWFWYLGTLVPVIGIVQVGMQGLADRYTYIPLIGVFIGVVWTAGAWLERGKAARMVLGSTTAIVLLGCGLAAHRQAGYWHDDLTLFRHALALTSNNAVAECHVGAGLAKEGKLDAAQAHFNAALADDPYFYQAYSSLGSLFEIQGKPELAIEQYQTTLKMRPWDEFARIHLAALLAKLGRGDEALAEYKENLRFNPESVEGNYQLGSMLTDRGELDTAAAFLAKAVDLKPSHVDALLCLSDVRLKQGKLAEAERALEAVVRLYPTNFELRINFAGLLWERGKAAEALAQYSKAVRLAPGAPIGHYNLAVAYAGQGRVNEAAKEFEEAIRLKPDYVEALSELAWLLATNPRSEERDGAKALTLARRALELGAGKQARTWAALDVALAETGQFPEAINAAEKAQDIALTQGQTNVATAAEKRLLLYKNRQPFRLP